jgi:SMI1 / KNR4 family (SUKH-1)
MLPDDLREYFLLVNGMDINMTDEDLIRFWPLEEVKSISEGASEYSDQAYLPDPYSIFMFADYCIWSHTYAIRLSSCEKRNEVYAIGGKSPIFLAGSFTEFATLYLANRCLDFLKSA